MIIYIDESGILGKKERYFVLAVFIPQNPKRTKNIIKRCYVNFKIKNKRKEIKGSELNFQQKQKFLNLLDNKDDFSASYIVADKHHLKPNIIKDKNICYNYLLNFLLKQIIKGASENIDIILDNHSVKVNSINSLQDYIRIKAYTDWNFQNELTFKHMNSEDCKNLQVIDVIANIVWQKYNYKTDHLYNFLERYFLYRIKFPFNKFSC